MWFNVCFADALLLVCLLQVGLVVVVGGLVGCGRCSFIRLLDVGFGRIFAFRLLWVVLLFGWLADYFMVWVGDCCLGMLWFVN